MDSYGPPCTSLWVCIHVPVGSDLHPHAYLHTFPYISLNIQRSIDRLKAACQNDFFPGNDCRIEPGKYVLSAGQGGG